MSDHEDKPAAVHELGAVIETSCPSCGYDLRATITLSGARCPECGSELPFDQVRHHDPAARARRRARWLAAAVLVILIGLIGMLVAMHASSLAGVWRPLLAIGFGAGTAVGLALAIPRLGSYRPDMQLRLLLLLPPCMVMAVLGQRRSIWMIGGICALTLLVALLSRTSVLKALRRRWRAIRHRPKRG